MEIAMALSVGLVYSLGAAINIRKESSMEQKLRNIKYKLAAIWWLITRKNYYLLAYNNRTGKSLESYNVVLPEFVSWVQKKHGMLTSHEIIMELKDIAFIYKGTGNFSCQKIEELIEKLKK